jgi:signal peptidase II
MGSIEIAKSKKQRSRAFVFGYVFLIFIAGLIVFLDQWTKNWVRQNLSLGETWVPWSWLAPYARVLHWQNSGAAFGFFHQGGGLFTILAVVVALLIIYYFPRIGSGDWALRLAMGLQLGGAIGNLLDRLQHGWSVTDFVSVGTFPVFNIADASITLGVLILLLDVWLSRGEPEPAPEIPVADEWPSRD